MGDGILLLPPQGRRRRDQYRAGAVPAESDLQSERILGYQQLGVWAGHLLADVHVECDRWHTLHVRKNASDSRESQRRSVSGGRRASYGGALHQRFRQLLL